MNYRLFLYSLIILLFIGIVFAQEGNFSEQDSYLWLNKSVAGWTKSIDDMSLAIVSLQNGGYPVADGVKALKASEDQAGCWPRGSCDVKTTAFATLALAKTGNSIEKEKKWLNATQIPALSRGTWYLQINSPNDGTFETSCEGKNKKTWNLEKNKITQTGTYWLDANELGCGSISGSLIKTFEVNAANLGSATISLIYNIENEYYILETIDSTVATVTANNACMPLKRGGGCSYEATSYASWVLTELEQEINTLTYLESQRRSANIIDHALLYLVTGKMPYADWLKSKQKVSGSFNDDVYTTSIAAYALVTKSTADYNYYTNATDWLKKKRGSDFSWNKNIVDTSMALIAIAGTITQGAALEVIPPEIGVTVESNCIDSLDDDLDGKIDCEDSDCIADPSCKQCGPTDECDEDTDCATDQKCNLVNCACESITACNYDDVCDDNEDCSCSDCATTPRCLMAEANCADGLDDDNDNKIDCEDSDCTSDPSCEKKFPIWIPVLIVVILIAGGGITFLFFYLKKTGKKLIDIIKIKGKKKGPTFEEFLKAREKPITPTKPFPSQQPVVYPRASEKALPKRPTKPGKEEEELEKAIREAEKLLGK